MLSVPIIPFLYASTLLVPYAANAAVVSLFIPDAQPGHVTANFLGTDSAGHTTWAIGNGQPSDSVTATPIATMVAGPSDLHLVEDVQSAIGGILHDDCGIKDGVAVCTIVLSGSASVRTVGIKTESASAFEVPVGATAPPAAPSASPTGAQAPGASATGTAATTSDTASPTGGSGAGDGPSAQTADGHGNGAGSTKVVGPAVMFAAVGISIVLAMIS
ncbi:hypothetical protein OH76DRAFT_1185839 [Lentinus brumalis]|uniref:Uncharacterized protein n=1 Tax=Lentinus brumalis TaxID=2498619 RepID=A0A371CTS3_9APHY|nr:hypothetical protein OH76DRAFT_1185839 [Polyporus brumalis]